MGMYTQLHFGSSLKKQTPQSVLDVLSYMCGEREDEPPLPDHPLFRTDRWTVLFTMDSYYFDYKTTHLLKFDDIGDQWYLNVTSNLKNYDDEIGKFIDWIMPYCDQFAGDFLGYRRYEEAETPTIIYADERVALPEPKKP